MDDASLRADCSRCVGLCCVALAFGRSELFAIDKPAGVPCANLAEDHACRIHDKLESGGFAGCSQYDCEGAGQLATAAFGDLSWKDGAATGRAMFAAFAAARRVQRARVLLTAAESLGPNEEMEARRKHLLAALQPAEGWTVEGLALIARSPVFNEVQVLLKALRSQPRAGSLDSVAVAAHSR